MIRCLALALAIAMPARADDLRYVVRADPALERLDVTLCFSGPPPLRLVPGVPSASSALIRARGARGDRLRRVRGALDTSRAGRCVRYELDLEAARSAGGYGGRFGRDVATTAGAWLWRPARLPLDIRASVRFELPEGVRAAVPWPRDGEVHRLDLSAFQRASFTAFGTFRSITIQRASAELEVVRLDDRDWDLDDDEMVRWLERAADAVATVQGRFPVDRALILLVPGVGTGVGFGMVRRGGGAAVAFVVGKRTPDEDALLSSWVTWHELSHLLLPAMRSRDAWFYEGLATYYQEVLRARVGIQSPRVAWREILEGFARGRSSGTSRPLHEEAATMMQTGAFLRVYWTGAFFALEADVALRARGSSLDAALARGALRWRGDRQTWTSREICALWDDTLDAEVLRSLRDRYVDRRAFPDPSPLLRRLGIAREDGRVLLRDAELSAIRDAIMQP